MRTRRAIVKSRRGFLSYANQASNCQLAGASHRATASLLEGDPLLAVADDNDAPDQGSRGNGGKGDIGQ